MISTTVTVSKSSAWWRAVESVPAFLFLALIAFASGCGKKAGEEVTGDTDGHWTAAYDAFGGAKPAPEYEAHWREFLDRPVLGEVKIETPTVMTAIAQLNGVVREASNNLEIEVIQDQPDFAGYRKPVSLKLDNPSVAGVLDAIAKQAGLVWDFQGTSVRIRPKRR